MGVAALVLGVVSPSGFFDGWSPIALIAIVSAAGLVGLALGWIYGEIAWRQEESFWSFLRALDTIDRPIRDLVIARFAEWHAMGADAAGMPPDLTQKALDPRKLPWHLLPRQQQAAAAVIRKHLEATFQEPKPEKRLQLLPDHIPWSLVLAAIRSGIWTTAFVMLVALTPLGLIPPLAPFVGWETAAAIIAMILGGWLMSLPLGWIVLILTLPSATRPLRRWRFINFVGSLVAVSISAFFVSDHFDLARIAVGFPIVVALVAFANWPRGPEPWAPFGPPTEPTGSAAS